MTRAPTAAIFSSSVIPQRSPQSISPEHDLLTGTLPDPVDQCCRVAASPVAPRDRAMIVEQTVGGERRVACGAVRCAGPRPYGAAPAAGVRTMRCSETTRACIDLTAVGGSLDAAAGAGERRNSEVPGLRSPRLLLRHSPSTIRG